MDNYLVLNGKRIDLTKEQIEVLGLKIKKKSPFDRVSERNYYYIESTGKTYLFYDCDGESDNELYNVANYCTDKELMTSRAKEEVLSRLLWRFSMENGGNGIDWQDKNQAKWHILHDKFNDKWITTYQIMHGVSGAVYFIDVEVAQRAIDEIVKPFYARELEVCKIWEE